MKFTVYQGSRQGPRPFNQDRLAYSYSKEALMLAVADGMGGHRHGEVAAQLAIKMLSEAFQKQAKPKLSNPKRFLNEQINEIHESIDDFRQLHGLSEAPRSTLVAAVVQADTLYIAHVGDSRLYHFRNKELIFRTHDHSVVQMLLRKGQIRKEDMAEHPERHKIYNCLGGDKAPQIELSGKRQMQEGDILLLCTDGLWTTMSDSEITQSLHYGPVNTSAARLLDKAEALGQQDGDNTSLLAIQWGDAQSAEDAVFTGLMPLGQCTTIFNPPSLQTTVLLDHEADTVSDMTDADIELAIATIQAAIHKTKHK